MTPPSMESIFLILSGVILAAGILYWLWSHIQLTQKKVQLLENAVFELRGRMVPTDSGPPAPAVVAAPAAAPSAYEDLADDDWDAPAEGEVATASTPLEVLSGGAYVEITREGAGGTDGTEDAPEARVEPGGRIVSAAEVEAVEEKSAEEFRELFLAETAGPRTPAGSSSAGAQPLESMPVKELRRLAEQRGIAGVAEMRKKELLAALRQQVSGGVQEKTLDLTVEHVDGAGEVDAEAIALE